MTEIKPLRSVLYMPSSNERALEKAKTIAADAIIFDLEDAVAPDAKPAAREAAAAAVQSGEYGRRELIIRVNGIGTEWHDDDMTAAAAAGPDVVLVPKVNSAEEVQRAGRGPRGRPVRPGQTKLWAMVETPIAMLNALSIAQRVGAAHGLRDGHQRPGQGAVRRARPRPPARDHRPRARVARRPRRRHRRSSTASTTT